MSIGERIKEVRQIVGLTQTKFAERIAVSTSYLARIELGSKKVNARILRLLSMEYNVDEHWLRTGEGAMFSDDASIREIKAMSLFKSLNPRFQDCALNQLNELLELFHSYKEK